MKKLVTVEQAAQLIQNGDLISITNMGLAGCPDIIFEALEKRFLETGEPRNLGFLSSTNFGRANRHDLANRLSHKGMVSRMMCGHWTSFTEFYEPVLNNEIEAYNLPQGIVAINYYMAARRVPKFLSRIGVRTFMDPRYNGCALNEISKEKMTELTVIDGKEYLFYKTQFPDVLLVRGTTADPNGNITFEKETCFSDTQAAAFAVKNNNGRVIVQVERISDTPAHPKDVIIPGHMVSAIYLRENPRYMGPGAKYDPTWTCEVRTPAEQTPALVQHYLEQSRRPFGDRVIARRAALELKPGDFVNLGAGIPMNIALEAYDMGLYDDSMAFTIECGSMGGIPIGDNGFGVHIGQDALYSQNMQMALYEGRGMDFTGIGALQIDKMGNINVIRSGRRIVGTGGFNHTSYAAKTLCCCFKFMVGSELEKVDGKFVYTDGKAGKFVDQVEYIALNHEIAKEEGQRVLYITERCVFEMVENGLMLIEIAPGIDVDRDIRPSIPFDFAIAEDLKEMPAICFPEN